MHRQGSSIAKQCLCVADDGIVLREDLVLVPTVFIQCGKNMDRECHSYFPMTRLRV